MAAYRCIITGKVECPRMYRVTPPRICCRRREWAYAPTASRSQLNSLAAASRPAPTMLSIGLNILRSAGTPCIAKWV